MVVIQIARNVKAQSGLSYCLRRMISEEAGQLSMRTQLIHDSLACEDQLVIT